ncbi:unnamed protein product [Ilex paraguariensis]|uniref:Pentatricopeptide repeat-containing protein n=2 Tax=Ilex paraguariensis TaxID=185542 RepID=A0ABC8R332_9AQUA
MAISFPVKLGFPEPALQLVSLVPTINSNTINSTVPFPSLTTQKFDGFAGSKLLDSTDCSKTSQQSQVQALVDLLHICAEKGSLREAKTAHGYVLKSNFEDDSLLVLLNHVAHTYSKCSDLSAARIVFNKMSLRNVFSWTVMVVGSTENGFFWDGLIYFSEMLESGIFPDAFMYSAIIQSCIAQDCIDLGKQLHAQIIIRGFACHIFVNTSLLNMYAKLGVILDSCQVFDNMTEHNEVSWNSMISGFTANGLHVEALSYFLRMKKEGFVPNMYTLASVLKAVGNLGDISKGKQVHKYVSELGLETNVLVGTALIDMYIKCGALCDARSVFYMNFACGGANMPWNAMIAGYSHCQCSQEALELYINMCQNNVRSDLYTYCSVFNAIAELRCLQFGRQVHGMVLKSGYDLLVLSVKNAIVDSYSKCGSLEDVKKVFDRMEERDIVSWTTLVTAYSQCSKWEEALAVFFQMREEGCIPNQFTFASVLDACASLCFLEYGYQIHGLLYKVGLNTDRCIESALIDMYAKCGSIALAAKVFESISKPDVVSWTAIISSYAQHGSVAYALELFRRMEQQGIKANGVTFLCVLFACSHGGMVDEGLHYFYSMKENYGLVPEMEHYACIVDLLGRVGRLDDALKFVRKMPLEPNEMVWQALLGGCRIHGNVELGERAAEKILSIQPEYSATYVLLSNTYMETGSFRDGLGLRNVMKEQGVKKEPGYSWISVGGKVHKFYAGDKQHLRKEDIYLMLEELMEEIKAVGHVPDLSDALPDHD